MRIIDPAFARIPETTPLASPAQGLRGGVLGLLANGKPNAAPLLEELASRLAERHGIARIVRYDKTAHGSGPSTATPEWIVEKLAAESTAVLLASGD